MAIWTYTGLIAAFPALLIKALRAEKESLGALLYTALACIAFGITFYSLSLLIALPYYY